MFKDNVLTTPLLASVRVLLQRKSSVAEHTLSVSLVVVAAEEHTVESYAFPRRKR